MNIGAQFDKCTDPRGTHSMHKLNCCSIHMVYSIIRTSLRSFCSLFDCRLSESSSSSSSLSVRRSPLGESFSSPSSSSSLSSAPSSSSALLFCCCSSSSPASFSEGAAEWEELDPDWLSEPWAGPSESESDPEPDLLLLLSLLLQKMRDRTNRVFGYNSRQFAAT